jgi:tetratricopeptide (TPR) repeat protein
MEARRGFVAELRREEKPWHEARCWLEAQPFMEVAVDYCNSGLWEEADGILRLLTDPESGVEANTYPMLYYYLGYISEQTGRREDALTFFRLAAEMPHDYCFPFRLESVDVLQSACRNNREDARAHYYLGNLLYELRPEDAIEQWELAASMGGEIATLHRNLAFAYTQVERDLAAAITSMERAVEADGSDPRLYYELDLLYEAGGISPGVRLDLLEENHDVVATHNDAFSREIVLLTLTGRYDEAIEHMRTNHFRRWEGLGNIHTTFVDAHLLRGLESIARGRYQDAVVDFEAAHEYPSNLEVARPYGGGRSAQIHYLTGTAYEAAGHEENAAEFYRRSATAERGSGRGMLDYYQGMAHLKLGDEERAGELFAGLLEHARGRLRSLDRDQSVEFFTKFGSRRSLVEQRAEALYLQGLALLGMGREGDARRAFREALTRNRNHLWARAQMSDR